MGLTWVRRRKNNVSKYFCVSTFSTRQHWVRAMILRNATICSIWVEGGIWNFKFFLGGPKWSEVCAGVGKWKQKKKVVYLWCLSCRLLNISRLFPISLFFFIFFHSFFCVVSSHSFQRQHSIQPPHRFTSCFTFFNNVYSLPSLTDSIMGLTTEAVWGLKDVEWKKKICTLNEDDGKIFPFPFANLTTVSSFSFASHSCQTISWNLFIFILSRQTWLLKSLKRRELSTSHHRQCSESGEWKWQKSAGKV